MELGEEGGGGGTGGDGFFWEKTEMERSKLLHGQMCKKKKEKNSAVQVCTSQIISDPRVTPPLLWSQRNNLVNVHPFRGQVLVTSSPSLDPNASDQSQQRCGSACPGMQMRLMSAERLKNNEDMRHESTFKSAGGRPGRVQFLFIVVSFNAILFEQGAFLGFFPGCTYHHLQPADGVPPPTFRASSS